MTFHRAASGEYHCPVLFKPFTNSSHVVANKITGNVYSYEVFMREEMLDFVAWPPFRLCVEYASRWIATQSFDSLNVVGKPIILPPSIHCCLQSSPLGYVWLCIFTLDPPFFYMFVCIFGRYHSWPWAPHDSFWGLLRWASVALSEVISAWETGKSHIGKGRQIR